MWTCGGTSTLPNGVGGRNFCLGFASLPPGILMLINNMPFKYMIFYAHMMLFDRHSTVVTCHTAITCYSYSDLVQALRALAYDELKQENVARCWKKKHWQNTDQSLL